MHMWFWWGYNLGEFLFKGLEITTKWSFALTWLGLFFFALLFEASKVYLADVQRAAQKRFRFQSDERRNLLCEREHSTPIEASTSRNASARSSSLEAFKIRMLVNIHQTGVFVLHNTASYLLMLAVMLYNFYLLIAVVLGLTIGYFIFGPRLTRLQMQCVNTKAIIICTPECDDTAETSTPPLLDGSIASESDFFICRTRSCSRPSHDYSAEQNGAGTSGTQPCSYGAKKCLSKVARAKQIQQQTLLENHNEKTITTDLSEAEPLKTTTSCCKKKVDPEKQACCKKSSQLEMSMSIQQVKKTCCKKVADNEESSDESSSNVGDSSLGKEDDQSRGESPKITCCANKKTSTSSQEQILK